MAGPCAQLGDYLEDPRYAEEKPALVAKKLVAPVGLTYGMSR